MIGELSLTLSELEAMNTFDFYVYVVQYEQRLEYKIKNSENG